MKRSKEWWLNRIDREGDFDPTTGTLAICPFCRLPVAWHPLHVGDEDNPQPCPLDEGDTEVVREILRLRAGLQRPSE